jgi:hypothetical protein
MLYGQTLYGQMSYHHPKETKDIQIKHEQNIAHHRMFANMAKTLDILCIFDDFFALLRQSCVHSVSIVHLAGAGHLRQRTTHNSY